jgi:hypothetical protein
MPIEKVPSRPLPINYVPRDGWPYKVKDGDSWETLARANGIAPKALVYFNFNTNNPDEVNWYLRRNTGCKVPTKDGLNWTFSLSAQPGIIYIPAKVIDFEPQPIRGKLPGKLVTLIPEHEDYGPKLLEYVIDTHGIVDMALAVSGVELGLLGLASEIAAPIAAELGVLLVIGNAWAEALNYNKRQELISGFTLGVVLGADGRDVSYLKRFVKEYPVYNSFFPEQGENLKNLYNVGLATGYYQGKQLNGPQRVAFFLDLYSHMKTHPSRTYGEDSRKWDDLTFKKYYWECSGIFRGWHLRE